MGLASLRCASASSRTDTVVTRVTVKEVIADKKRVRFDTVCLVADKPVLEGEALLMVPSG